MAQTQTNPVVNEVDDEDELSGICGEYSEHRGERTTYEDEDGVQWECTECGAEGWEDK